MTSLDNGHLSRAAEVAFKINSCLPADYQQDIFNEYVRVMKSLSRGCDIADRSILIVGGAGYIGTVLTDHLLDCGYRVRCLDSLIYNNGITTLPFRKNERYEFVYGDLANPDDVLKALDGITDVVLLAGLVGDPITKKFPEEAARVNDDGHLALLGLLNGKGLNRVIFVSTCSNYGLIEGDVLANEEFELKPLSLYAKSKVAFEGAFLAQQGKVDYTPVVFRFATAFGLSPRMRFDLTISEFTRALALGEDLLVFDANTWRPYCHVRDFSQVIRRGLEAPVERVSFQVFNAGGGVNNNTKQMIVDKILAQIPGAKVSYKEKGEDPRNYRVDFSKISKTLHFEPSWMVEDGIAELLALIRQGLFHDITQPASFYGNWQPKIAPQA